MLVYVEWVLDLLRKNVSVLVCQQGRGFAGTATKQTLSPWVAEQLATPSRPVSATEGSPSLKWQERMLRRLRRYLNSKLLVKQQEAVTLLTAAESLD